MYPFKLLIGSFGITNYWFFQFLGLIIFLISSLIFLPKDAPVKKQQVAVTFFISSLTGYMGAKILHIILYREKYIGMPLDNVFSISGNAALGGFILAFLTIYVLFRYFKISFLLAGDFVAPFFSLFRAFGRVGCLLTGCCAGAASGLPWARYFGDSVLRHPTQAYMVILTLSIFIAGGVFYKRYYLKLREAPGVLFFSSVIMYSLGRFFIEFFRIDSPFILGPLKLSHIALIPLFFYGAAGLYILFKRHAQIPKIKACALSLFGLFAISLLIAGTVILTILYAVPKKNFTGTILMSIGKGGVRKIYRPKTAQDILNIARIDSALRRYKLDNGRYPAQEQGLLALVNRPDIGPVPINWRGPYIGREYLKSKGGVPYGYLLKRRGDDWSYRIIVLH